MHKDDKISDLMQEIQADHLMQNGHQKRDMLLTRFNKAWQPLVDHMQQLAAKHLPANRRLRMEFSIREDFESNLNISIDLDRSDEFPGKDLKDYRWIQGESLQFYRRPSNNPVLALVSKRLTLSDIFLIRAGNSYALGSTESRSADPKLRDAAIHPDRMDKAKNLLEYWLAKQIKFDFDKDRLNPASSLEISMTRKGLEP